MISTVRGIVLERSLGAITVEVGGIGLRVFVPERTASVAPDPGGEIRLFTYLNVRENALELFGFATAGERALFRALIGVSGVGPRIALAVLSRLSADEIAAAIQARDVDAFCKAPGVGRKTAQRILLELAERFDIGTTPGKVTTGATVAAAEDAIQALIQLGYTDAQARKAVSGTKLDDGVEASEIIREALKRVAAR